MRNTIHPRSLILASTLTLAALPALAVAAPAPASGAATASASPKPPSPYSFGARIGGMGFRQQDASRNSWNDCRMNGVGVFGQRAFGRHAYVETGADLYFAQNFPTDPPAGQPSMDRVSGLLTAAAGMRMFPESRISAFAEVGGGVELTTVKLYGVGSNFALPLGFVGAGGEIRLGDHLKLGAELRTYVMADYRHGAAGEAPVVAEPQAAAQGQFFARYTL